MHRPPSPYDKRVNTGAAAAWKRYRSKPATVKSPHEKERAAFLAGYAMSHEAFTPEEVGAITLGAARRAGVALSDTSKHWPGFVGFAEQVLRAAGHTITATPKEKP